jgi:esterase/lipase
MKRKVFCIGGLGTDEQIFSRLSISNAELVTVKWLIPEKKESFSSYVQRMMIQVNEPEPILLGISFGGMVAVEMANHYRIKKAFIISSVKHKYELPLWMKILKKIPLHLLLKPKPNKLIYPIEDFFLGANDPQTKNLAAYYRENIHQDYLQWAIHEIINWQNVTIPQNLIHIQGTADRVFPLRNMKVDFIVANGKHFMIYNRSADISIIINKELENMNE